MSSGSSLFPMAGQVPLMGGPTWLGATPRISSLLIKPASAVCNLDCSYCFYLDRDADPYKDLPARRMTDETLERLVDTYLFYSYPQSTFAFQGGEPTLAGLPFFEKLIRLQQQYGRNGHSVSNALQTNAVLLDDNWAQFFRQYNWLLGVSLDGPEGINDLHRYNRAGHGTWKRVMQSIECLKKNGVEFNILCVLNAANVEHPREIYKFYKSIGIDNIQYIPLAEFNPDGSRMPFTITPEQYGRFLCETFDLWWPDRKKIRIRFFDNIAEALAGQKPGSCTMHETCDSYCVVEYNGDVYPCDFFVEGGWKLGNIEIDSWTDIARRSRRYGFAHKKTLAHPDCQVCDYQSYKMIYAKATGPLRQELKKILGREVEAPTMHSISPY
ncbi:MAG: anaerobic sulfatase maturase [Acidobacteria bacterium]|nr:anaerobic sulfatase maturase [Acidobacteriota bacterium]